MSRRQNSPIFHHADFPRRYFANCVVSWRGLSTKNIYIQKTHLPFIPVHPPYPIEAKLSAFDTQKASLFCTFVVHFVVYHEYITCIGIYLGQSRVSHLLQSRDQVTDDVSSLCTFICAYLIIIFGSEVVGPRAR